MVKIENICALEKIKKLKDNSQDIIYADPPYALGSTVKIGEDGKPYYKEARDFMSKWEMPDEKFWEEFFKESMRVLKYGGRVLFFGIDRQLMLFQYYATYAGLETRQSLYWYFITNFPKATDLSKQIDKRLGIDREVTGIKNNTYDGANRNPQNHVSPSESSKIGEWGLNETPHGQQQTESNTELGKKYEGFKYSISPLKQVLETIMVFQKQTKNKSVLDDVFAYEEGDSEISVSAWNIDGGRVTVKDDCSNNFHKNRKVVKEYKLNNKKTYNSGINTVSTEQHNNGRFPPQMFIDEECALRLDEQSGELTSGARKSSYPRRGANPNETYGKFNEVMMDDAEKDSGGCSRILHHIGYHDEELDLVMYSTKVSTWEREFGCSKEFKIDVEDNKNPINIRNNQINSGTGELRNASTTTKNNHPTLKPIKLNYQIAKLLKTPTKQSVFFPFSGAGSEIIGFIQAGFDKELFECSEISKDFVEIALARIEAWKDLDINNLEEHKKHLDKKSKENENQGSLF